MPLFPSIHPASRTVGSSFTASVLGGLALMTLGCLDSGKGTTSPATVDAPAEKASGKGFPGLLTGGVRKTGYYYGNAISYVEKNGKAYFQGDIILDESGLRDTPPPLAKSSGFGLRKGEGRWSGGKIYYVIDPAIPNPERITMAMSIWSWQTSLQFLPYTGDEWHWIRFQKSDKCASLHGVKNGLGEQLVEVADFCHEDAMLHEIGHAIGLIHEHSRPDRDQYLTINWKNMQSVCVDQYDIYPDQVTLGPLDLYSIMLYPSYMCSLNPELPAVTAANGDIIEEKTGLSLMDLDLVHKMYPLYTHASSTLARDIGAGAAGTAYIISNASAGNGNYTVRRFNSQATTRWESFSGSGVRIDVDINGRPWVAKANGSVQRWSGSSWATVGSLTGVKDIGIGASSAHPYGSVYVLSSAVMNGSNYSLYRWTGSTWTRTSGSGVSVSVDPAGLPWTVNAAGQLHRWTGSQWQLMGEGYADVGVGSDGHVYATSLNYLFRKIAPSGSNATEHERSFFSMAEPMPQGLTHDPITRVDGGPGDTFWTLTAEGEFDAERLRGTVDRGTTNFSGPQ